MTRLSQKLIEQAEKLEISQTELARRVGISQPSISDLFAGLTSSPRKWREIARELQIPEEEMRELMIEAGRIAGKTTRLPRSVVKAMPDLLKKSRMTEVETLAPGYLPHAMHGNMPTTTRQAKEIQVLGQAAGGADGEFHLNGNVIGWVACPPILESVPGAYAIYVSGDSMSPRYNPGETVFVHPNRPPRSGDDVVVQLRPKEEGAPRGFIKKFVEWAGDRLILKQFNPEENLSFDRKDVVSIHTIVMSTTY